MMVAQRGDFHRKLALMLSLLPRQEGCLKMSFIRLLRSFNSLSDCYADLGIPEDSDESVVRDAFIGLSKKYHPDSGSKMADTSKFLKIQDSYKFILASKQKRKSPLQQEDDESSQEEPLKHTAPQHRQYLTYEGIGYGTPSQRHKQYQRYRVERATENVFEHHKQKYTAKYEDRLIVANKSAADQIKKSGGMARLVEDLIQESMTRGEFDNLSGMGKPLKDSYVPYGVDSMTHNINKILINNGYAPEWITMEKEIKVAFREARKTLFDRRHTLGAPPLDPRKNKLWRNYVNEFKEELLRLNKLIDKFNMIAPVLSLQMPHFRSDIAIGQAEQLCSRTIEGAVSKGEVIKQATDGSANVGKEETVGFWKYRKASDV